MSDSADKIRKLDELTLRLEQELLRIEAQSPYRMTFEGVIHSLKNSIAGISSASEYIYLLAESMQGTAASDVEARSRDLQEVAHFSSGITRSAREMCNMISTILAKAGRSYSNDAEVIDLSEVLKDELLFIRLRDEFRVGGIRLVESYASEPVLVKVVPHDLIQVFNNIIYNSLEELRDNKSGDLIEVSTFVTETCIGFEVRDNGSGIDDEILPRIFDALSTTKDNSKARSVLEGGSGLGLFSSRKLVKKYGGRIDVQGQLNPGCAFRVCLPAVSVSEASEERG